MKQLSRGRYYGNEKQCVSYSNVVLTETEYTHDYVDWHYHEHPYFTFLLEGGLFEANKKEAYYLKPGQLVFHNWQDAHYNKKPNVYTRGFHVELTENWFRTYGLSTQNLQGSFEVMHPKVLECLNKIVHETRTNDSYTKMSVELLLVEGFEYLEYEPNSNKLRAPIWIHQLIELLNEAPETCNSLTSIADTLNIHPVHLSRTFPKFFKCTIGNYLRTLRLNKALNYLKEGKHSLTEIGYLCQFSDQSHFIRSFKKVYGVSPKAFCKKKSQC